jgi:hypothetical protein
MMFSVSAKIAAAALIVSWSGVRLAQADDRAHPVAPAAMSCQEMLEKAKSLVANLPSGVEKMAAQKELASAQIDLDKGAETECKSHVHNAAEAIKARSTN